MLKTGQGRRHRFGRSTSRVTPGSPECTLADAFAGDEMLVTAVEDEQARLTCLRFGMAEGATVRCVTRIPAGPIVLRSGRQEIAVGRDLAARIKVRRQEFLPGPLASASA